jgi:hypothetical protein
MRYSQKGKPMAEERGYIPMSPREALDVARAADLALRDAQRYFEILKDQGELNHVRLEALKVEAEVFRAELSENVTQPMLQAIRRNEEGEAKRGK